MTEQKVGLFERSVQRLAQVFVRMVDTLEGTTPQTGSEETYLTEDHVQDMISNGKGHHEQAAHYSEQAQGKEDA